MSSSVYLYFVLAIFFRTSTLPFVWCEKIEEDGDEEGFQSNEEGGDGASPDEGNFKNEEEEEEPHAFDEGVLRGLHESIDKNKDGKISYDEVSDFDKSVTQIVVKNGLPMMVDDADNNKDGKLTLEEYIAHIQIYADEDDTNPLEERIKFEKAKFQAADKSGNKVLEGDELQGIFFPETDAAVFDVLVRAQMDHSDEDGDGRLSYTEFNAAEEDLSRGEDNESDKEERYKLLDTDRDGFLTPAELAQWQGGGFFRQRDLKQILAIADGDSDGHVTADELVRASNALEQSETRYSILQWHHHRHSTDEL